MFVIQYYKMFVKQNGNMTADKQYARLFSTIEAAQDYLINEWFKTSGVNLPARREAVFIVEVETKQVMSKVKQIVGSF